MRITSTVFSSNRFEQGGIRLRVLIVLLTLCIVGATIYQLLHTLGQNQQTNHRKALAISEYGLMMALQQEPAGATPPRAIPKTAYDEGWYRVTTRQDTRDDTLFCTVTSIGKFGSATEQRECILRLTVEGPDSTWVRESMH